MSVEDEKTHKCYKCGQTLKLGHSQYHDKDYCRKYPYDEYTNLMNDWPASEYTPEEKLKLGLIQEEPSWQKTNSKEFMQEYICFPSDEGIVTHPVFGSATYIPTKFQIDESLIDDALRVCFCLLDCIEEEIDRIPENGYTSKLLRQTMLLEKKLAEETQRKLKELLGEEIKS